MNKGRADLVETLHRETVQRYWEEQDKLRTLMEQMQRETVERCQKEQALVERLHQEAVEESRRQPITPVDAPTVHCTELPEAKPDSPLYREWNTYRREVTRLLAEGHAGRHVLIKDEQIIGIWDTHADAMTAGYQLFPSESFLVHEVQERECVLRCVTVRRWPNLLSRFRQAS